MRRQPLMRKGTTVDDMVRAIGDAIVKGDWLPGERLDELGLAAMFDVSRTPVREALRQLVATGLVERRPNRGAVVAIFDSSKLAAMYEALAEIEGVLAKLAAERMDAGQRLRLEQLHDASAQLVRENDLEAYEIHNSTFHGTIHKGASNEHLLDLLWQTRSRVAPFRRVQFRLPNRLPQSFAEHAEIMTAILRGDGATAQAKMCAHVTKAEDDISRLMDLSRTLKRAS